MKEWMKALVPPYMAFFGCPIMPASEPVATMLPWVF
jgi:hypothetical protein